MPTTTAEAVETTETAKERKNRRDRERRAAKKAEAVAAQTEAPTEEAAPVTVEEAVEALVETPEAVVIPEARAEAPVVEVPTVPEVAPVPVPTGRTIKHSRQSALSNDQKRALSAAIIARVADMVSDPEVSDTVTAILATGVPIEGVAQQVANWMDLMPGEAWDSRLPAPQHRKNQKRQSA